ncbi:uncharacterized protein PRCAT00002580001 [Priceomyces carsonii]|uniref:uncharacterized protein n=1 Tax=Priceomyces carsonii TaxID=28549 RepID=UPI002ED94125|nr:unnamed protein product [Priceomyces carsonii]
MSNLGNKGSSRILDSDKYQRRQKGTKGKYSKDKKLNAGLKKVDKQYKDAVKSAARTEILLQEEAGFLEADSPMEKTFKFKQGEIQDAVDIGTSNKKFSLSLPDYGPYTMNYSRNGRNLLIGGQKGHVASVDWRTGGLNCELFLNETVHAVTYLHNDQYFACAQKKYTFIYDKTGAELHRLKQHIDSILLDFLPYHFLLVSAGNTGFLKYHDVSTGELVSELRTKMGPTQAMKKNPWNAVMHLGHGNGTVSLWAPNMSTPLAKIQSCRGPIRDLAIDREGRYMAVAGADKSIKIMDIRKFKEVDNYYSPTPASSLDFSDNGLLSVGWGPHVTVWKDVLKAKQSDPYMNHLIPSSRVEKLKFLPFEDIIGVGHQKGFSSLIIPGSGEANYDSLEINPYETAKQRQEQEVKSLLNKLSPDTISLDPNVIGTVNKNANSIRLKLNEINELSDGQNGNKMEIRPEVKGSNSSLRKHLRKKRQNVIDQRKMKIEKNLKLEKEARQRRLNELNGKPEEKDLLGSALSRFE